MAVTMEYVVEKNEYGSKILVLYWGNTAPIDPSMCIKNYSYHIIEKMFYVYQFITLLWHSNQFAKPRKFTKKRLNRLNIS